VFLTQYYSIGLQALDVLGYLRTNAKPLIIFGHSFGSILALHLCRRLRESPYLHTPHYLIVSGGTPVDVGQSRTKDKKQA
jgi:surfactin synthase thioesterase subunit